MNKDVADTRILFLASNPKGMDKLRLDEEARNIKEGLRRAKERERFIVETVWAVRPRDIRRAVLDFEPNVVHFSGHGMADGGLAFENELGKIQLLPPKALSGLFKLLKTHVECVVLNACYSELQASAIAEHINFVVGIGKDIKDRSAIEFSGGFYDALMAGCLIETAYEFGCNAICIEGLDERHVPVLIKKICLENTSNSDSQSIIAPSGNRAKTEASVISLPTIEYEFVLSGHIEEANKQKVEAIVSHLREVTGDTTLTWLKVESGSIKITLKGSEKGFQALKTLIASGNLSQIKGLVIRSTDKLSELDCSYNAQKYMSLMKADELEMNEKLRAYFKILGDLSKRDAVQENWIAILNPILEKATQCCLGEVTYCIHKIEDDTIQFEYGGPATYIVHRESTENSLIDKGLIGETIKRGKPYAIYPDVHEHEDSYIQGNPRTLSELVVVMPDPSSNKPIGAINIESNQGNAFDHIDGIGFSLIGLWASLLKTHTVQREKTKDVLTQIASDFTDIQAFSKKDDKKQIVFSSLSKLIGSIISPDALAIVSFSPADGQLSDSNPLYRYEHREGYGSDARSEGTTNEQNSFPAHVIRNHMNAASRIMKTTVVEVDLDLEMDRYRLRSVRPATSFAIGIGFSYESIQKAKFGALILEFDEEPKHNQYVLNNLQLLTYAQMALVQQIDLINEREILRNAVQGLSTIHDIASSTQGLGEFLNRAPEKIAEDVHASGCAFYEIAPFDDINSYNPKNNEKVFLKELGYFSDSKRSNVFWRNWFNKEWITHLREAFSERKPEEFLIEIPSSDKSKVNRYTVFARSVRIFPEKKVLFVSFKQIIPPHNETKVSEISRDILNAHLSAVERIVEEKLKEFTNGFQKQGLTQAVRMWLNSVAKTTRSSEEETKHQLFLAVHEFLLNWEPTQTPLSAIFLIEKENENLVMAKSTIQHLRENSVRPDVISELEPLKFDTSSALLTPKGLTQRVLNSYESILSFNITREGNQQCREFWDAISETTAEQRWFAGVPIYYATDSKTHDFGVLTINGIKPLTLLEQLQTGQSIRPVIKIVADELGAQLYQLLEKENHV